MSHFADLLAPRLPDGIAIPDELAAAWDWLEAQGWGEPDSAGYTVESLGTAPTRRVAEGRYALWTHDGDRAYGVMFTPDAEIPRPFYSRLPRFEPGGPGTDRLAPFAVLGEHGEVAALWLDDGGAVRIVEVGPEGTRLIADDAAGFLRAVASGALVARGFPEETPPTLREDDAAFRAWVTRAFGEPAWPEPAQDDVAAWSQRVKREHAEWTRQRLAADALQAWAEFPARIPEPTELERRFGVLGVIEAILTDHTFRHTYVRTFRGEPQRIGRFDNAAGDAAYAFFADDGAFVRLFDHEDETSPHATGALWPGLLDGMPERFEEFLRIPEFEDADWDPADDAPSVTAAAWHVGDGWRSGAPRPDEDGVLPDPGAWMLPLGDFTPESLAEGFGRRFGVQISPSALRPFVDGEPLTRERVLAVNPDPNWEVLSVVAEYGGYPSEL